MKYYCAGTPPRWGGLDWGLADILIVKILSVQSLPGYQIFGRQIDDTRSIINEFAKGISALALYRRFFIHTYLTGHDKTCCVECTIVRENYRMGPIHIFEPNIIVRHILNSQTNGIVNCLSTVH